MRAVLVVVACRGVEAVKPAGGARPCHVCSGEVRWPCAWVDCRGVEGVVEACISRCVCVCVCVF